MTKQIESPDAITELHEKVQQVTENMQQLTISSREAHKNIQQLSLKMAQLQAKFKRQELETQQFTVIERMLPQQLPLPMWKKIKAFLIIPSIFHLT